MDTLARAPGGQMRGAATKAMSDIVEERQQRRYAPFAAAPLRAAARGPAAKCKIYFCASPKVADVRSGRAGKDGACEPTCSASRFGVQPSGFIDSVQAKPELRTGF